MLNYTESVLKKKPELFVIQTETNDLTDRVKTMNEVRKRLILVSRVLSINLTDHLDINVINGLNLKLKCCCEGDNCLRKCQH